MLKPPAMISATFVRTALAISCVLFFGYLLLVSISSSTGRKPLFSSPHVFQEEQTSNNRVQEFPADCPQSPLATDISVVLKTGATESWRLKVHSETDLRCIPRYIVVSDLEERRYGLHAQDILKDYPDSVKESAPEFNFYRTLQELHVAGKPIDESVAFPESPGSKEDNLGWKLDKWKFIPMIQKAVEVQPLAKWYVFIEADTYLVWPNLLAFLERYDFKEPYYIGAPNSFPGIGYAHGGSGFVLSSQVALLLASYARVHQSKVVEMTEKDCCGDSLIARVMKDLQIELVGGWPHIQGETPESQDYTDLHWCYPVVSFHHMQAIDILAFGQFERSWFQNGKGPITHKDVFEGFVRSKLTPRIDGWDNRSSRPPASEDGAGDTGSGSSYEACSKVCEEDSTCIQFSWQLGQCRTWDCFSLGSKTTETNMSSGYLLDRIDSYIAGLGKCSSPSWIGINRNSEAPDDGSS